MTVEQQVKVNYVSGEIGLNVPISGDLASLLALEELKEIKVHGFNLLFNSLQVQKYLQASDSAITKEADLAELLESRLSKEDVEKIHSSQMHARLVGQQFSISEIGNFAPTPLTQLTLVVPEVKVDTKIVEAVIENLSLEDKDRFISFLPPTTEEEKLNPVKCVSGELLRHFLNEMQTEEGGLDMNSQLSVYTSLITNLPDDDPTKKMALTQMRFLMQFADVVSNKSMRLSLTKVVTERNV